jgi:hypothetical protein
MKTEDSLYGHFRDSTYDITIYRCHTVTTDFTVVGEDFHKPEDLMKDWGKHYYMGMT